MRKKTNYFIFFVLLLTACSSTIKDQSESTSTNEATSTETSDNLDIHKVKISGTITGAPAKTLFFNQYQNQGEGVMCTIAEDGKFSLDAPVPATDYYKLYLDDKNMIILVLDTKTSSVTINADSKALAATYNVSGSKDSELMHDFFSDNKEFSIQKSSMEKQLKTVPVSEKTALERNYKNLINNYVSSQKSIALANPSSPAALTIVSVLDPKDHMDAYDKVFEGLKDIIPNSVIYTSLKSDIEKYKSQISKSNGLAPEIEMNNPEGKTIKLSSLRGKYVLIDFWASWCGPCRRENPNVVKLYNKYKDKGFEVFSVSLDKNLEKWKGAIEQDQLIWPNHVSDLAGWQSSAAAKYGVSGIPHTVLIDKEGKILATKLRGPQLASKLAELMD